MASRRFPLGTSVRDRLLGMRDIAPTGCWIWNAQRDHHGYGRMSVGGKSLAAHRVSYELFRGPIPSGLVIDHLCKNKGCCNPEHLEAVSQYENMMRTDVVIAAKAQRACKYGHPFSPANTRTVNGRRWCRACDVRRQRESQRRRHQSHRINGRA